MRDQETMRELYRMRRESRRARDTAVAALVVGGCVCAMTAVCAQWMPTLVGYAFGVSGAALAVIGTIELVVGPHRGRRRVRRARAARYRSGATIRTLRSAMRPQHMA